MNTTAEIILKEAKKYSGAFRESVFQIYAQKIIRNCRTQLEKEFSIFRLRKILLDQICPECERVTKNYKCNCQQRGI
jgi:hypothetical protein